MLPRPRLPHKNQRGVLIIWLALFMLTLLGFVAIGVDMAKLTATHAQLQAAADAAALAGATAVDSLTGVLKEPDAIIRAQFTASQNKAFEDIPTSVVVPASDISFPAANQVKVIVRREAGVGTGIVTHFAKAINYLVPGADFSRLDANAMAIAQVDRTDSACCNLIPVAAIPIGGTFSTGCGNVYILKEGAGAGGNGNYGFIDFPQCDQGVCAGMNDTGKNTLKCLLENGYCCCIGIGQVLNTEPGNASGPGRASLTDRFNNDSDRRANICYSDYRGNGQRIVTVPITTDLGGGRTQVTILGFASFFLRAVPGSGALAEITGEFLDNIVPGHGNGGPPGSATTFSVRLVQ